jgi:hypothetical protein
MYILKAELDRLRDETEINRKSASQVHKTAEKKTAQGMLVPTGQGG